MRRSRPTITAIVLLLCPSLPSCGDSGSTNDGTSSATATGSSTGPTSISTSGSTGERGSSDGSASADGTGDTTTSAGHTTGGSTTSEGTSTGGGEDTSTGEGSESSGSPADCSRATWNPADAQANIVFSSDDLEVTVVADSVNDTTRATMSKSAGRWYWEVSDIAAGMSNFNGVCVGDSSFFLEVTPGSGGDPGLTHSRSGTTTTFGGPSFGGPSFGPGSVVGVALDADTSEAWLNVDGVWLPTEPSAGPGLGLGLAAAGEWFPCINLSQGDVFVGNFGQDSFVHPVPAGFNAGVFEGDDCGDEVPPPPPPPPS
ncbi:MAG: hypothetical protein AB1Z98_34995 [Nannocystaceae bacterium]